MDIRIRLHHLSKNLLVISVLGAYLIGLNLIDANDGNAIILATLLQIVFTFAIAIRRVYREKNILDPFVWFPPIFSMVNLISCIFAFTEGYMYWFEPYRDDFQQLASFYLRLNTVALIAFYIGNMIIIRNADSEVEAMEERIDDASVNEGHIRLLMRLYVILITLIFLNIYSVIASGGLAILSEIRGVDQFAGYGGIAYLINVVANLLYFSIVSMAIPVLFMVGQKKFFVIFFIIMFLYLIPSFYAGGRSSFVFLVITLLLNYFIFHKEPEKIINLKTLFLSIITFMVLVVFFGALRDIEGGDFTLYLLNFFGEIQLSSGVGVATVHFFPDSHSYYYGGTYISSIFNLIPNILFGGARPFVNPSIVFHDIFAPDQQDLGFGFSIFAEAYMNGGVIAVFLFFSSFSIGLNAFFLNKRKSLVSMAMVSVIFMSCLWFLRGDSTAFVKTLVFSYLFFKVVSFGIHAKTNQDLQHVTENERLSSSQLPQNI